ncbi:hypothetical protein HNY73_010223 [Argiope bruennichi]|uniref:Uncharacterized protein n=1 Tax=Argiope bruennichi TaxID=94029 RepID=A0A8T0F153_ARGBR|nr:hypothetical protein HNY73_010223 [Argiope bruennichi]
MAFFTRVDMTVPLLPAEIGIESNNAKKEHAQLRPSQSHSGDKNSQKRFEYVVDPELGVQAVLRSPHECTLCTGTVFSSLRLVLLRDMSTDCQPVVD